MLLMFVVKLLLTAVDVPINLDHTCHVAKMSSVRPTRHIPHSGADREGTYIRTSIRATAVNLNAGLLH